jgi:hypothetical protein
LKKRLTRVLVRMDSGRMVGMLVGALVVVEWLGVRG